MGRHQVLCRFCQSLAFALTVYRMALLKIRPKYLPVPELDNGVR